MVSGTLFTLPGGDLKLAAGYQFEYAEYKGFDVTGPEGQMTGPPVFGGLFITSDAKRYTHSLFGELVVPVVGKDMNIPLVESLTFDIQGRYDHYSDFGATTNPKFGLTWEVIDGLTIKGSIGTSFGAPNLGDTEAAVDTRASVALTSSIRVPTSISGVSAAQDLIDANRPSISTPGGSPGLVPQTANTNSFGAEYQPDFLPGLDMSLEAWHVSMFKIIAIIPYTTPNIVYTVPAYAPFYIINPTLAQVIAFTTLPNGQPIAQQGFAGYAQYYPANGAACPTINLATGCTQTTPYLVRDLRRHNLGNQYNSGLDFHISYATDLDFGTATFGIDGTDYTLYKTQGYNGGPLTDGLVANYAPYQFSTHVGLATGPFNSKVTVNYIAGYSVAGVTAQTSCVALCPYQPDAELRPGWHTGVPERIERHPQHQQSVRRTEPLHQYGPGLPDIADLREHAGTDVPDHPDEEVLGRRPGTPHGGVPAGLDNPAAKAGAKNGQAKFSRNGRRGCGGSRNGCSNDFSVADIPVIDTHIHLFDGRRPQGAPYLGNPKFHDGVSLPGDYRAFAAPLGIAGALSIDASPWLEDNLWVLEQMQPEPFMVGMCGNLQPEKPEFAEYLDRFAKNPLFRGIRYGNIWGYDIIRQLDNPVFVDGLRRLQQHDLVLDTANPRIDLLQASIKASDKVPDLRIVIDHMMGFEPAPGERAAYDAALKELSGRKNVFIKLSQINHAVGRDGKVILGLAAHRARFDTLVGAVGEDRVMFWLGWPGGGDPAVMKDQLEQTREYFGARGRAAAEKFFWRNSAACFKWIRRSPSQPAA